jgi:tocopherol cyclase
MVSSQMHLIQPSIFPGIYDIKKLWLPNRFQGNRKRKNYFEGWYFKHVTATGENTLSFIPGVSLHDGDHHAFVQVINGKTGQTWYFRYPTAAFSFSKNSFAIKVGNNYFSLRELIIDLKSDTDHITGELSFDKHTAYPVSLRRPGIMGWYRYVPFMECYHGVVSLNHLIRGTVNINKQHIDFTEGKGYIEKDWGSSMPESWIWMQSNHFPQDNTSFMLSVAKIPWIGKTFTGFLGFLLHKGTQYHFATYTGAKINNLTRADNTITIDIKAKDFRLKINGEQRKMPGGKTGALRAPVKGQMDRVIHECIDSKINLTLTNKNDDVIFSETAINAGLEMIGNTSLLEP